MDQDEPTSGDKPRVDRIQIDEALVGEARFVKHPVRWVGGGYKTKTGTLKCAECPGGQQQRIHGVVAEQGSPLAQGIKLRVLLRRPAAAPAKALRPGDQRALVDAVGLDRAD